MFERIDLNPKYDHEEARAAQDRWNTPEGQQQHAHILSLIQNGGGEDFLQWEFEQGNLSLLKDQWDLAGFDIWKQEIDFPVGDNFEAIDFSHSRFWHSKFSNACFLYSHFSFTKFYNTEFHNCLFMMSHFYNCTFEGCRFQSCDFAQPNGFVNTDFKNSKFDNCFFEDNKFEHCRFDENSSVVSIKTIPNKFKTDFNPKNLSGIHRGIKEAFLAGGINSHARHHHFLQNYTYTRHNTSGWQQFAALFGWEKLSGYGLRPLRVLSALLFIFALSYCWFLFRISPFPDFQRTFILTAGALFTFGAQADQLSQLTYLDDVVYVGTSFLGISLLALFITVTANILLKDN